MGDIDRLELDALEEKIRLTVQTKTSYCPVGSQARWLDRKLRAWVGGATTFIDEDSFIDCLLTDFHIIGCRHLCKGLYERHKEDEDSEEWPLLDTGKFADYVVRSSIKEKADKMRRSMGAIY